MPRDANGNYALPAGNPVVSGEVISSNWANTTMDDLGLALTDSLDRSGRGGMLAPFRFADGTNLAPGATWANEPTTGLYRFASGDLRMSIMTNDVMRWNTSGVQIWDSGNSQWNNVLTDGGGGGSQVPVNIGTADGQTLRWEDSTSEWEATSALVVDDAGNVTATGDLTAAFFIGDGSQLTNVPGVTQWDDVTGGINYAGGNVGIGTATPSQKLDVDGVGAVTQLKVAPAASTGPAVAQLGEGRTGDGLAYIDWYASAGVQDFRIIRNAGVNATVDLQQFGSGAMTFWTDSAERMSIDSSGNVKINTGNLELSNGGGWYQSDASWVRSLNDVAVYNANTTANAFTTPGDFTAGYSDMRLKTHLGTIPDALDKVCSLEGFYYERNDKAVELGYTGGERRVGLSAQDVQAVLPEVVKDAPINIDNGTDYLTIDYERVVPLLVESIKDLRAEIDELKRNQK